MKLFGFGKDIQAPKGLKGAAILKEMGEKIKEFVAIGEQDRSEVKDFSSMFITNCDKVGMKPMFSCVGNARDLIEMLHSTALEDEEFGKILVTAAEAAIFKNKSLQRLQIDLTQAKGFISKGVSSPEELIEKISVASRIWENSKDIIPGLSHSLLWDIVYLIKEYKGTK